MKTGVSAAEYNAEKGLMKITGDVEPMTLVHKLTRWGKKTELVSVNYNLDDDPISDDDDEEDDTSSDTSSTPDPKTQEKKTGILRKPLFGCFSSKSKVVQPYAMRNRNWYIPSKFENGGPGFGFPYTNASTSQWPHPYPMMPPYPPMMQQQQLQQQLQAPMAGAVMPNNVNMFWSAPPLHQTQPYFMPTMPTKAPTVNSKLHYPEK